MKQPSFGISAKIKHFDLALPVKNMQTVICGYHLLLPLFCVIFGQKCLTKLFRKIQSF